MKKAILFYSLLALLVLYVLYDLFFIKVSSNPTPNTIPPTPALPTIILESGLPNYHLIETAFIPQAPEKKWDQPWQDACEEASLLTLVHYYQHNQPPIPDLVNEYQQLFSYELDNNLNHDINIQQMANIASNHLNLRPEIINSPTVDIIKKYLAENIPIIITANGKTLYQENKHFKSGGPWYHSLVILGYNDATQQFLVHDVGTQFGAYFKYSYSLILESIHDLPSNGRKEDIDTGDKKILVLLQ